MGKYSIGYPELNLNFRLCRVLCTHLFTHVNLEGTTECKIVYNHWGKTAKIGSGWKSFVDSQNLKAGQEIKFEFSDPKSNFVLLWISL